ncbi:MAG: trypsin-like peptidase domain-containing protein [Spirochaetaceae bacterium]|nr:trypsin-like peptidase domain-containing protein [Spirochaetaceae bacterium]MDT8296709.1 trypsin-like peptidase domain-containing protein [Spirochaetaceae bacterium]
MRRRHRKNVLFSATTAALLIIIFLLGFGIIDFHVGKGDTGQIDEVMSSGETESTADFVYQGGTIESVENPPNSADYTIDEMENITVYDRYNEAVVNITTEVVGYNWFLEPVPKEGSSGSGSIIDSRGYILTNNHVVENAYKVNVTLADGIVFEGDVIGSDPENDLAVVKFDPDGHPLVTIPFGSSHNLRVGQKVLAIGNPFAFERTLTTGIISGLGRPLRNDKGIVIRDLVQTDASINPGNSGGPLLDAKGRLIGVNTMIYTPSGGSVGIGFAVPVATAQRVVPDLIQYGFVQRGWIDIDPVQLFPSLVRYADLPVARGVLISQVTAGGNAEDAGLQGGQPNQAVRSGNTVIYLGGDIIIDIAGETIASLGDMYAALEKSRPGDVVEVTVVRGRRKVTLDVTLASRPGGNR